MVVESGDGFDLLKTFLQNDFSFLKRSDAPVMGHLWEYCLGEELETG